MKNSTFSNQQLLFTIHYQKILHFQPNHEYQIFKFLFLNQWFYINKHYI